MNHVLDAIAFFAFFMLGVILMLWVKINDLSDMKEELTVKKTIVLFLHKEWKSYGFSITVAIIYAGAHDEWMRMIMTSKLTPDLLISQAGAAPLITSALFGIVTQYAGYKWLLGKLEKLFRNELQSQQAKLKQENEQMKQTLELHNISQK